MADLASLIFANAQNQPNYVDQFQKGRQQTMSNQLGQMQLGQLQNQMGQQGRLSALIQGGASPQDLAGAGFLDEAKQLKEVQAPGKDSDFLKEARKSARQNRDGIDKKAGEVRSAYNKAVGLADKARTGSRAARAGMIISTARLLSPGIVTDADFQALTGGANPVQAAMAYIGDKNPDVAGMLGAYVDPLGDAFDADALLGIAGSTMASEAGTILSQQADVMKRASMSGMPEDQISAIFSGSSNIEGLRGLLEKGQPAPVQTKKPPAVSPQSAPSMTNKQGWRLETDAAGNRAYVSPDRTQFEELK